MKVPLEIYYGDLEKTEELELLIHQQVDKLERYTNRLNSCRIAIEKSQTHRHSACPYRVRLDLTLAPGHEMAVEEEENPDDKRINVDTLIRRAFDSARHQITKLKKSQVHHMKSHPRKRVKGIVTKLFPEQGYGFIKDLDGQDVYFHQNSVHNNEFDRLTIGMGVRYNLEMGENGLQASTVFIEEKHW